MTVTRKKHPTKQAGNAARPQTVTPGIFAKVEQIRDFHEIRADGRKLGPLTCLIEPAP